MRTKLEQGFFVKCRYSNENKVDEDLIVVIVYKTLTRSDNI